MDLFLLLVLNAILLIRPAEFVPGLVGAPLYEVSLALTLVASWPRIVAFFQERRGSSQPIFVLFGILWLAAIASNLTRGQPAQAWETGLSFFKTYLYCLIVVSVITTLPRLKRFLYWTAISGLMIIVPALLNYHGVITLPGLGIIREGDIRRLGASGIFGDPNDMCFMVCQTITLLAVTVLDGRASLLIRVMCVGGILISGSAMALTYSRGGFLGLLGMFMVYLFQRHGRRALPWALLGAGGLFLVFGGRQTNLLDATQSGTGQTRIHLWDMYFELFKSNPILGIGANNSQEYDSHVPHNTFLHAFSELGFVGGCAFLGMFYSSILIMRSSSRALRAAKDECEVDVDQEDEEAERARDELNRLTPFLCAWLAGSILGMLSLSRLYIITTYSILAVILAYEAILSHTVEGYETQRATTRFGRQCVALSLGFLIVLWLYIRRNASYYS